MQTNLEQAIEIIRALPVEDYGKLREVIDWRLSLKQKLIRARKTAFLNTDTAKRSV